MCEGLFTFLFFFFFFAFLLHPFSSSLHLFVFCSHFCRLQVLLMSTLWIIDPSKYLGFFHILSIFVNLGFFLD